jgi:hypothetical protein
MNSRIKYIDASRVSEMIKMFNAKKTTSIIEKIIVNNRGYFLFKDRSV